MVLCKITGATLHFWNEDASRSWQALSMTRIATAPHKEQDLFAFTRYRVRNNTTVEAVQGMHDYYQRGQLGPALSHLLDLYDL